MVLVEPTARERQAQRLAQLARAHPVKYASHLEGLAVRIIEGDELAEASRAGILEGLRDAQACQACGKPLRNVLSRRRGIGPECWGKGHRAVDA